MADNKNQLDLRQSPSSWVLESTVCKSPTIDEMKCREQSLANTSSLRNSIRKGLGF